MLRRTIDAMEESRKGLGEKMIEIRKYSNRRLYDTSTSQYVTLSDVAKMIRDGVELRVVDAKTAEDLTRAVMLQIICESKSEQEALPIGFLREVIQASSKTVRTSIKDFLTAGVSAQKEVQHQVGHWMKLGALANPLVAPFVAAWEGMSRSAPAGQSAATSPPAQAGRGQTVQTAAPGQPVQTATPVNGQVGVVPERVSSGDGEAQVGPEGSQLQPQAQTAAPTDEHLREREIALLQAQLAAMQEQVEALRKK